MSKKQVAVVCAVLAACVVVLVGVIAVQAMLQQEVVAAEPTQEELQQASPPDAAFDNAMDSFAYKTAAQVLATTDGNINYSPPSLYYALAMAASGANGDTLECLLDMLEVPNQATLMEQGNNLYRYLHADEPNSRLKLANSLWMSSYHRMEPTFAELMAKEFYASTFSVKFGTEAADKKVNQWVEERTKGTIVPKIRTNEGQVLSIFNTIYFFAEWQEDFRESLTEEDSFYLADGTIQKCDFMQVIDSESRYTRGEGFLSASRSLKGGNSMMFILPEEGTPPRELIATPELARAAFEGGDHSKADVRWKLPKFSFNNTIGLVEPLKVLGLDNIFSPDADFSMMADTGVYVDDVTQMTHIAVDEKGVTAAAFTDMSMSATAIRDEIEQIEITLDRPFIYAIKAVDGTLLFIGICDNPQQTVNP